MPAIGYQTRTASKLAADIQARALDSMEIASKRVQESLRASAAPYEDTGAMAAAVQVDVFGGIGISGPRELGMIATCPVEHADWVDKGTGHGAGIRRPSGKSMPVGQRSPNRKNAGAHAGSITMAKVVRGQPATHWFSRPHGIPLNEHMRSIYAGIFRRAR